MNRKNISTFMGGVALIGGCGAAHASDDVVVATDAYTWKGDTLYQGEFKAWTGNTNSIRLTY